jgi:ribonuclease HII
MAPTHQLARSLVLRGYEIVVGIDEVGRGCLAGPVTAAAVILPLDRQLRGVYDSKLMTPAERERAARRIKERALAVGIGWSSHLEIDAHGLTWAVRTCAERALGGLIQPFDAILLDGKHNYFAKTRYTALATVKADQISLQVAAASVVAKVARDRYMIRLHRRYPEYNFRSNKGYATPEHLAAVQLGLSPVHRRRFRPVMRQMLAGHTDLVHVAD